MGGLVQQPPHPGAHRRHAAGRSRGTLLRYAGAARHGSMTQTKLPPKNPARFTAMETGDHGVGYDPAERLHRTADRRVLSEGEVRAGLVVVAGIEGHDPA